MSTVYLLLGADLGDKSATFAKAKELIAARVGSITAESSIYESEAWGFESKALFYNQVLALETALSPQETLEQLLDVEAELGRVRSGNGYTSRVIDIDILLYGTQVISTPQLVVPHPRLPQRMFALAPLCELVPMLVHPTLHKTVAELKEECTDKGLVRKADFAGK